MGLKFVQNQKGQTVVEYILLLSVAVSVVLTFYNSQAFKKLFGDQGTLGKNIKSQSEFAYRHAFTVSGQGGRPPDIARDNREGSQHPSYKGDPTRFFGPNQPYGE